MKNIYFIVALLAAVSIQHSFAQDLTQSPLLISYYNVKDAMISGNAATVTSRAEEFIKTVAGADEKTLPTESRVALLKDAEQISNSKNIKQQREIFAGLSTEMVVLAKAVKLSKAPVYQQYCPMKKASWLSSSKAVRNPYFGNAMLTCGKVTETL